MIKEIRQEINLSLELAKKIKWAIKYTSSKGNLKKGALIKLEPLNVAYVDPHKLTINNDTLLFFNGSDSIVNDVIDATKTLYNGLCNMIYHLCADGLIPQKTYDEFSELFNDNKGKWINGKYYTKGQLEKLKQQKNNGYEL